MEDKPSADAKVERDRGRAGFSCPFSLAKNGTGTVSRGFKTGQGDRYRVPRIQFVPHPHWDKFESKWTCS